MENRVYTWWYNVVRSEFKALIVFHKISSYFHIWCFNAFVKPFFIDDVNKIVSNLIIKNLLKYAVNHNYGIRWWYKWNVFYYFYFLLILVFYGFVRIISALDVKYQKKEVKFIEIFQQM